ncbi:MAG TPA: sulfotransferase [Anaerolineales bacterium]|nr:sulfotransferase [Anaerolineales bacterium]
MESGPIFIGGLDQSGKTPLRRMLSAHPELLLTRRTYMWSRFYQQFGSLSNPSNLERCLSAMLAQKAIQEMQPDPQQIRREFIQGAQTYARLFELFHRQSLERAGKRRWGDQLGFVERFAEVIFSSYPDAKMIHMIRDPRDSSAEGADKKHRGRGKSGWLTARWKFSAHLAQQNSRRYNKHYLVVRYEDLMQDTEKVLRRICTFLNEDYLPEMLEVLTSTQNVDEDEQVENHEHYPQVGASAIKTQITFTQLFARHDLIDLGYTVKPVALSAGERIKFSMIDLPANLAGLIAWNLTEGKQFLRSGAKKEI